MYHINDLFEKQSEPARDIFNITGEKIDQFKVGDCLAIENKSIGGGRGNYILATYAAKMGVGAFDVQLTVYDSDTVRINRHPQYPLHNGMTVEERMYEKILRLRFGFPAKLSKISGCSIVPHVYDLSEQTIQVTKELIDSESLFFKILNHEKISKEEVTYIGIHNQKLLYLATQKVSDEILVPMEFDDALAFGKALCDGLDILHQNGYFHKNITPRNIIGTKTDPKLINFYNPDETELGLSVMTDIGDASFDDLRYLAPEGILASRHRGPWSDVFSIAHVLYYAVTGKPVYDLRSYPTVAAKIDAVLNPNINLDFPHQLRQQAGMESFEQIITQNLNHYLDKRMNIQEFSAALNDVQKIRSRRT